ncbi:MAG: hypothetical protein WCF16_13655 [Alphaproteobacteria bacterium]
MAKHDYRVTVTIKVMDGDEAMQTNDLVQNCSDYGTMIDVQEAVYSGLVKSMTALGRAKL